MTKYIMAFLLGFWFVMFTVVMGWNQLASWNSKLIDNNLAYYDDSTGAFTLRTIEIKKDSVFIDDSVFIKLK